MSAAVAKPKRSEPCTGMRWIKRGRVFGAAGGDSWMKSHAALPFAVPRGDSNFRLEVNKALTRTYAGGEIDPIFRKWFAAFGRPSALLAAVFVLNAVPE